MSEGNKAKDILLEQLTTALNILVDTCQKTSDGMGGTYIPMDMLIQYKDILIKKYGEGLKENPTLK